MSQPLYIATLEDGTKFLINENQVSTIKPGPDGVSIIKMSNGDVLTVTDPNYANWEADAHTRKF